MVKTKKPLKAKTSLKAKTTLKPSGRKKRRDPDSYSLLNTNADKYFSYYIRLRDSEPDENGDWYGVCITCPRKLLTKRSDGRWTKGAEHGHLISRGNHFLRYDEENGNLQCSHCNAWLDKDEMIRRYRLAVDEKFGEGTYKKLKKAGDANKDYRCKKGDFRQVIHDSKEAIAFYEKQSLLKATL